MERFTTKRAYKEPEWFRLGRDAVRVMDKLGTLRELRFYLHHPEPFIRLHAIRRLSVLLLQDAILELQKIPDDPLENEQNREEARRAIRRISQSRNSGRLINQIGEEAEEPSPAVRCGVKLKLSDDAVLPLPQETDVDAPELMDDVLIRIQMEEKRVELDFSPVGWFTSNARHLCVAILAALGKGMILLLKGMGSLSKAAGHFVIKGFRGSLRRLRRKKSISPDSSAVTGAPVLPVTTKGSSVILDMDIILANQKKRIGGVRRPSYRRRRGGSQMFKLLFYPIRLVRQHWVFTLVIVMAFYLLLGFTRQGRFFVYRLNPGALRSNDVIVASVKDVAQEFFRLQPVLADSDKSEPNLLTEEDTASSGQLLSQNTTTSAPAEPMYRVVAPKGLNLREAPAQTASRILFMPLDSEVCYLGKTQSDAEGNAWLQVSFNGSTGWAMARWMQQEPTGEVLADG